MSVPRLPHVYLMSTPHIYPISLRSPWSLGLTASATGEEFPKATYMPGLRPAHIPTLVPTYLLAYLAFFPRYTLIPHDGRVNHRTRCSSPLWWLLLLLLLWIPFPSTVSLRLHAMCWLSHTWTPFFFLSFFFVSDA